MLEHRLMTVKEAAEYLHVGINTCYSLCKEEKFPVITIGNKLYIDKNTIDSEWIPNKLNEIKERSGK